MLLALDLMAKHFHHGVPGKGFLHVTVEGAGVTPLGNESRPTLTPDELQSPQRQRHRDRRVAELGQHPRHSTDTETVLEKAMSSILLRFSLKQ